MEYPKWVRSPIDGVKVLCKDVQAEVNLLDLAPPKAQESPKEEKIKKPKRGGQ